MTTIDMSQYPDAANSKDKVETLGMLATLVTSSDVPDDVVYAVTKEVMENLDKLRKLHPALESITVKSSKGFRLRFITVPCATTKKSV